MSGPLAFLTFVCVAILVMQGVLLYHVWPERAVVKPSPWQPQSALESTAARWVADVEPLAVSGEAKRHQVYAALIKAFPTTAKRDLAFAIETVMQGHPRG